MPGPGDVLGRLPHEPGQRALGVLLADAGGLAEARLDRAGAERRGRDPGAGQLGVERVGVGEHEGLRPAVAGLAGQRLEGGDRRDVEDRAAAALDHPRQHPAAQLDAPPRRRPAPCGARRRRRSGAPGPRWTARRCSTSTSIVRPRSATASSTATRLSGAARSAVTTSVRTPCAVASSSASVRSSASLRATSVRPWPRRASSRASSTPMPEEAPVTRAVRSGAGAGRAIAPKRRPGRHDQLRVRSFTWRRPGGYSRASWPALIE